MRFGIEIEATGMQPTEVARLLNENGVTCSEPGYTHRVMDCWKAITDGSVSGGFELVSPPLEYNDANLALVKRVVCLLNDAGCDVDRRCGLHVHFDVNSLEPQHVANIYNRYKKFEIQIDRLMPQSRRENNNTYCKSLQYRPEMSPRQSLQETINTACDGSRYYKVNLCSYVKYGTIEFRQHSGSVNSAKVCNWIKFLAQFIEASRPEQVVEQAPVAQPELVRPSRNFKGKTKAVIELLENTAIEARAARLRGDWRYNNLDAQQIAAQVGSTPASVQSIICRARRAGAPIGGSRRYNISLVFPEVQTQPTVRIVERVNDTPWVGIDESIVNYYSRRMASLSQAS